MQELNSIRATIIVDGKLMYQRQEMLTMFLKAAEWQSKQPVCIDANNKMPENGIEVDENTIYPYTKDVYYTL